MTGYFGGGVQNIEKPVEHYKIIDQRKKLSPEAVAESARFDEMMKKAATNLEDGFNDRKILPVKLYDPAHKVHRNLPVKTGMNSGESGDGTNIALKRLSKEMENQLMGMFWVMIDNARENDPEGGFAEKMFRSPYLHEVVKSGSDPELGEIGKAIYNNLVRKDRENIEGARTKK